MTDRKPDSTPSDDRAARRARALRENLLRRKAQARARALPEEENPADESKSSQTGEGKD